MSSNVCNRCVSTQRFVSVLADESFLAVVLGCLHRERFAVKERILKLVAALCLYNNDGYQKTLDAFASLATRRRGMRTTNGASSLITCVCDAGNSRFECLLEELPSDFDMMINDDEAGLPAATPHINRLPNCIDLGGAIPNVALRLSLQCSVLGLINCIVSYPESAYEREERREEFLSHGLQVRVELQSGQISDDAHLPLRIRLMYSK